MMLEASGHVGEFSDFMTTCISCEEVYRADTLLENDHPNPDSLSKSDLNNLLQNAQLPCPACESNGVVPSCCSESNVQYYYWMLVNQAVMVFFDQRRRKVCSPRSLVYTVILGSYHLVQSKLARGIETRISPRQGMIRLREFNMAELEYFIDPEMPLDHDLAKWSERS